jgi:signal transduction histidine kinase
MSGAMAHQMNNTLGAARARILRLMKRKEGKITDPYVEKQLQLILENLDGALGRLDTLRRPFRKEESQHIDIDSCVLEALKQVSITEGIEVIDDLSGDLPMLRAPRERITEVFRNLIKNAVEAMGEKGQLHLRSQLRGKWLEVSVGDTGPGISEDKQKKLFDLEYTAKTTTKEGSYGYGLWWTRTFLDRFGGHIHLESQLGVGSTFTVRLPMVMELVRE